MILKGKKDKYSKYRNKMSTKLNFVAVGVFYAELNELLACELAEDGYASVKVHITPHHIEVIILATCKHFFGRKGTMHP